MANYLLDTQIFIWANREPYKIPKNIQAILSNKNHKFYLSIASIWEMQIKVQLKKLELIPDLPTAIHLAKSKNIYTILPITESHILNLQKLDYYHGDPFDRIMISQAMIENLTFLTVDSHIIKYPIKFINN